MKQRTKQFTKDLLYKIDGYGFSQQKWFRKFYGGEWNKVLIEEINISAWVQGKPSIHLQKYPIIETENWQS